MKIISILAVGLLTTAAAVAETGSGFERLQEGGKQTATLDHCEGYVRLSQTMVYGKRTPVLQIRDVTNCSKISIDGVKQTQKIDRVGRYGQADVVIYETPGRNVHRVTLESGSGATEDTIEVVSYDAPQNTSPRANIEIVFSGWGTIFGAEKTRNLYDCGGQVSARLEGGDQLTLVFRDVKSCSKFDILSADGSSVNYPQKSLQATRDGEFAGSFTIPKRYIDAGRNSIKVILKSNSGRTDEVISVRFTAL